MIQTITLSSSKVIKLLVKSIFSKKLLFSQASFFDYSVQFLKFVSDDCDDEKYYTKSPSE